MSTQFTINGTTYTWPDDFDQYKYLTAWPAMILDSLTDFTGKMTLAGQYAAAAGGAGWSVRYAFDASTTDSDPGAGNFRLNNATPSSATAAYIDLTDAGGADVTAALDVLDDGTSTVKGFFSLRHRTDPTKWALYALTGLTTATGYRKLALTHVSGAGTFSAADPVAVAFARTGDKGDTGATGATGNNKLCEGGTAGGTANALTCTASPAFTGARGECVSLLIGAASNSGSAALSANGVTQTIRKNGSALTGGELPASTRVLMQSDGTYLELISGGGGVSNTNWIQTAGGTANALTLTPVPAISSYADGQFFHFVAASNNSGAATINISGVGAVDLLTASGGALIADSILAGKVYACIGWGGKFRLTVDDTRYQIEYLALAGGGGGGKGNGGGGGGGGRLTGTDIVIKGVPYAVQVGGGGPGATVYGGTNGTDSYINGVATATGGGAGGGGGSTAPTSGGSGGGAGTAAAASGAAGISGQGYAGGNSAAAPRYEAGGGGGAGGVGGNANSGTSAGNGGPGASSSITGSSVTDGGGGGGACDGGSTPGTASDGGGAGSTIAGSAGTANKGGGGGGSGGSSDGGAGGSGKVVIRYLGSQRGTGGTITSSGGYTIHTFTGSSTFTA